MGTETTGFFREAMDRGFLYQCSKPLTDMNNLFLGDPVTGYVGFDCTADSLHVGNLASLMLLRLFKKHGHIPVVVMGTATSRIGDPSGKSEQRSMLTEQQITDNMKGILPKIRRIVDPDWIVENHVWMEKLNMLEFLSQVGQHFSVNRMLTQDSVKSRIENGGLSFLEFSYMILQAYDFVELSKKPYNCTLQMGGSDQWGNIVMGIELGRRMNGVELFGLTTPLITTAAGTKMGKTEDGAIWLNSERLTPYDYWQFWRNTDDADVFNFLKLFTDLDLKIIGDYEKMLSGKEKHPNYVELINTFKKILATAATTICHGEQAAKLAESTADDVFTRGGSQGLPITDVTLPPYGRTRYADLFIAAGLVATIGEARRLARDGGARVDDSHASLSVEQMIYPFCPQDDGRQEIKLTAGRKRHALIKFSYFHVR